MKRMFALIVLATLLCGCASAEKDDTFCFYYPRVTYTQNATDSVIATENREIIELSSIADILNAYMKGSVNPLLRNPFPAGLEILSVYVMEDSIYLTVSDDLAELTGLDLVLACTCLGQTAAEMTDTQVAQISCENAKLDGVKYFTVSSDTISYLDPIPEEITEPTTE